MCLELCAHVCQCFGVHAVIHCSFLGTRECSQVFIDTRIPVTPTNCCAYTPKVLQHVHIPLNTCEHSCVPLNTCKHSHVTLNTCKQACVLFIPLNTCAYPKNWKKCRIRACTTELHGIKPVRLNGSFDSKCTRPETSHSYQSFKILINTSTGIIVDLNNLTF